MQTDRSLSLLFWPALDKLKNKQFILSELEFEGAFSMLPVPNRPSAALANILGAYIACCYALNRQPGQLTRFDIKEFVNSQDINAVRSAVLACAREFKGDEANALSTYLLIIAGRTAAPNCAEESSSQLDVEPFIDRAKIRQRVEDYWRTLILRGRHIGETIGTGERAMKEALQLQGQMSAAFQEQTETIIRGMSPEQTQTYMRALSEEDESFGALYESNHEAGYRRLGLHFDDGRAPARTLVYQRQSIGEMAVRTAVRATIWETVRLAVRSILR